MECCAFLREAELLISVDTGQVHLAAAMGVPVISLSGSTSCGTWPYSPIAVTLAAASGCFNCSFVKSCPTNKTNRRLPEPGFIPACMLAITPDMVLDHAKEILAVGRP
jgi:ADP-heptose:LPS heptosyltransferase